MESEKIIELGKQKSFPKNGELYQRIRDLVHEYDGEVSTAEAIVHQQKMIHSLEQKIIEGSCVSEYLSLHASA